MSCSITVRAPAKINIGLEVKPVRGDGYHDIRSIFTTVNLFDTITVARIEKENTCEVECEGMVLPSDNTFTAAYKAFCVLTGIQCGFHVTVEKHIPSGGGLGGGSSDASSFIQSIDVLSDTHLKASDLHKIAGMVGSDCFFFTRALLDGKSGGRFAACVEGRGEIVTPIPARQDFDVILVFPGVSVSTKLAYAWVDETGAGKHSSGFCMEDEYNKSVSQWRFVNDFTKPVAGRFKKISEAITDLKNCGANFVDMSGSGSTVFGIFERKSVRSSLCHDVAALESSTSFALKTLSEKWLAVLA